MLLDLVSRIAWAIENIWTDSCMKNGVDMVSPGSPSRLGLGEGVLRRVGDVTIWGHLLSPE